MGKAGTSSGIAWRAGDATRSAADREGRAAVLSAAGLYIVGGSLTATAVLIPEVSSPAGVIFVGATALATAAGLLIAVTRKRGGLALACAADLWGVALIVVLCASTGGATSPFALLYMFAIGHASAFQPRGPLALVALACLAGFLAPLAYEDVSSTYVPVACVGIVLALLGAGVVHYALSRVREQRRRLEFLIAATAELDTSLDPTETLRSFADAAVPELAELCVIDLVGRDGSIGDTIAASVDPTVAAGIERMRRANPLEIGGSHPVAQVLSSGAPSVIDDLTDEAVLAQTAQSDEHLRFMRDAGYHSAAVFPMNARGRTHGAISFLHVRNNARYEPEILAVLEDLTDRAALAFDNARLYEERSHVAHTLRRSLMPAVLPVVPRLELASYFRPMGAGSEVGGDFYDAFGDDRSCWLMVGDVCGKGAEAAALTGFLRHTTGAYAREATSPGSVLAHVNRVMLDQDFDGRFATAILVRLRFDGPDVVVTAASAGHPAALIAREGGPAAEFGDRGTLLGVFSDPVIEETTTTLAPGDALALYTDGLLEAHAPDRTVTPQEMIRRLETASPRLAQQTIDALIGLVDLNADVRDDIAILAARVRGATGADAGARGQHARDSEVTITATPSGLRASS
ncbi:MAG TPA: GAF domain-containing SpoIIE family protein phosphatase [Solirubrobacteraceae bacterium]|nr:GAF domain-containing SpoIIE family protein phosphatase [Solirubrobacteraceae bacterium]